MLALGLLGFLAVGLSLGMLGGGGSILAVPVLVHLLGLPAGIAVPMSLPVVGTAAAFGAWRRWKGGQLNVRLVAIFAIGTMAASFVAARFGAEIPDRPRLLLFIAVMLVAATLMWRRARTQRPVELAAPRTSPHASLLVIASLIVGSLTGLVGVGGGFLIVPALVGALGLGMAEATATSLAVITLNTAAASAGWWGRVTLDWQLTAVVTAAALVGMLIGTALAPRVPARTLTRAFALLLVVVGVFMLVKEL